MNIKELAKKYNLTKDDDWQESSSKKWIVNNEACEKIAEKEGIIFGPRQVRNSEKNFVRVGSERKQGREWREKRGSA